MDFMALLKNNQLKATPQRMAVLKILNQHMHPTMDELYADIKKEYPSVSLATVYKNLNTLKSAGVVAEINMPNGKTKYDIFVEPHIHVVCDKCYGVQDIPYCKDLSAYQQSVEKSVGNLVSSLEVIAHVPECHKCLRD